MFYENYYDHSCIFKEKDVLETDIKGEGIRARLKRWWYDQFLLSTENLRCRKYYVSSFSVMRERLTHFRNYRGIIHPFSKFRTKWECFVFVIWICKTMLFHYNSTIVTPDLPFFTYVIAVLTEFITILDLFLNTRTGYINRDTRTIELNPRDIKINYFSTKVCFDAFSVIPLHVLLILRYGSNVACESNLCKSNIFVCTLKILNIFATLKVIVASRFLVRKRKSFTVLAVLRMIRISILFFTVMFTLTNISDSVSLVDIIFNGNIEKHSVYRYLINTKFKRPQEFSKIFYNFASEFSRICKTLLLFGYVMENSKNVMDKAKILISFVVSNLFFLWILIECFGILNRYYFCEDKREILRDRTINLLRSRQLPDALSEKVRNYYKYSGSKSYVVQRDNNLYASLLDSLKKEIRVHAYGRYIKRIPHFVDWPSEVLQEIVVLLDEDIYLKGDVVSSPWSQGDGLLILESGELSVYNINNQEMTHLIDGDFFGELSLVTDKEMRMSTVVAVTNSKVLLLDKVPFRRLMKDYPHLFFSLKTELKKKFTEGTFQKCTY